MVIEILFVILKSEILFAMNKVFTLPTDRDGRRVRQPERYFRTAKRGIE